MRRVINTVRYKIWGLGSDTASEQDGGKATVSVGIRKIEVELVRK